PTRNGTGRPTNDGAAMLLEALIRFVVGGVVVSAFSLIGDVVKPKTLAGTFGAAPSIALATLALTAFRERPAYLATEGASMRLGTVALLAYVLALRMLLGRFPKRSAWSLALPLWALWVVVAAAALSMAGP